MNKLGETMQIEMKLMELQKRIEELEIRQAPTPEQLEKFMQLMQTYQLQELSFGMLRLSRPWNQNVYGPVIQAMQQP